MGALVVVALLRRPRLSRHARGYALSQIPSRVSWPSASRHILIQAFFNISVVLALVPTKGITLPFVSYGGTSLFITLACIGVLLNITRECD